MSTIYTRATKGSALTWTEGDANITNLNNDKIEDIVEDTTPQLGGNLDVNGNAIVSASNGNIRVEPNGSGNIALTPTSGKIILGALDFPTGTGTNGQVLTTNGSSAMSWSTVSGGASTLDGLSDVVITEAATNDLLVYNGTNWVDTAASTLTVNNVSGTVAIANGGTGETTRQAAMDALAGSVTSGQYLRGNGTDVVMSAIQAADVPTLNQNTTGTAAGLSATLAIASGGTGATSAPAANAALMGFTTTATAAGTTTLTNASSAYQLFTGTSTQNINLPNTSTLATGWSFHIVNNSTGNLTLFTASALSLGTVVPGTTVMVTCISTANNTVAAWEFGFTDFSTVTGTGSAVLSTSPTLSTPAITGGTINNTTIGATTATTGRFTTVTSTVATGTAPFTVASTTNVANLNASLLDGQNWNSPGLIGSVTPQTGRFTTVTSTATTGTAPFVVASTTNVANLNASSLNGATFAAPGPIGSTTASTGAFTTLTAGGTAFPAATGTTGQVLALSAAGTAAWTTSSGGAANTYIIELNGTGATLISGNIYTMVLSEIFDSDNLLSISSNTFSIASGNWQIQLMRPAGLQNNAASTSITLRNESSPANTVIFSSTNLVITGSRSVIMPQTEYWNQATTQTFSIRTDHGAGNGPTLFTGARLMFRKIN